MGNPEKSALRDLEFAGGVLQLSSVPCMVDVGTLSSNCGA